MSSRAGAEVWHRYLAEAPGRRLARLHDFPPPSPRRTTATLRRIRPPDSADGSGTGVGTGLAALAALLHRVTGAEELVLAAADVSLGVLRVGVAGTLRASALRTGIAAALAESAARPEPTRELLEAARPAALGLDLPPCHGLVTTMRGYLRVGDPLELADLALVLDDRTTGAPRIGLLTNAETIDADHADRLAGMLGVLLDGLRADAAQDPPLGALPLSRDDDEVETPGSAATRVTDAHFVPVHERILAHARRTPDAPCLVRDDRTLTYRELRERSGRLANRLRELGAGPGRSVAVRLPCGPGHLVSQLAVLRTGASVFLLDSDEAAPLPAQPGDETETIVACIAAGGLPPVPGVAGLLLDDRTDPWTSYSAELGPVGCAPESAAHVAYTRGASGEPRPVPLSHAAWANSTEVLIAEAGMRPDTVGAWFGAPGGGLVQLEVLTVLAAGGLLRIPSSPTPTPRARRNWLVDHAVTHTLQLTLMAEALWELDWPDHTALRYMWVTGERMTRWPGPDLPYSVLNLYGSTEANLVALCDVSAVAKGLETRRRLALSPPVGRPVAGTCARVVDGAGRQVPPGVLGTLEVRGVGSVAGPDPWHSGDLARTWPDGQIEVLGPAAARPRATLQDSAPRGGTLSRLRALWADHAGVGGAGADAAFFDLGVDSVSAAELCRTVSRLWGADFSLRELTLYPTPEKAAEWLDAGARATAPAPSEAGYHPTPDQRALWRHATAGRGYDLYRWTVPGLDGERMLGAWRTVCEAHPALRTAIAPDGRHVPARPGAVDEGQARLVLAPTGRPRGTVELSTHQAIVDADSVHRIVLPALARLYRDPEAKLDVPEADQAAYASAAAVRWWRDELAAEEDSSGAVGATTPSTAPRFTGRSLTMRPDINSLSRTADAAGIPIEAVLAVSLADAVRGIGLGCAGWWHPARLPVYPRVEEIAGSFCTLTKLTARAENRSFAARARAAADGDGLSRPGAVAVAITVVSGADPDHVLSKPVYSDIDLRITLTEAHLRLHITSPEGERARLTRLPGAFAARLDRLCADEPAWWHTGSAEADGLG